MNPSVHVGLSSGTKIRNLMTAVVEVEKQLRREGRIGALDDMVMAHYHLSEALTRHAEVTSIVEDKND